MGLKDSALLIAGIIGVVAISLSSSDQGPAPPSETNSTCGATITWVKSGYCPKPQTNLFCFVCDDQCRSDYECEGTKKCCPQPGCGNWCKDVVVSSY